MNPLQAKLEALEASLSLLQFQHANHELRIQELVKEIAALKAAMIQDDTLNVVPNLVEDHKETSAKIPSVQHRPYDTVHAAIPEQKSFPSQPSHTPPKVARPRTVSGWEKLIGENLINKIGIIILVIGIAVGAKYAIDRELISPILRIILGYMSGIALVGIALRLKLKYHAFSAVLLSGGMAVLYFITYAAFDLYGLLPRSLTFILLLLFTIFTVLAAIHYRQQIIAHLGLVGAYAVPFLLSNNSGNVVILFTYMTIINAGILIIAYWKYWRSLFVSSMLITWLIFIVWIFTDYRMDVHFQLAMIFATIFFLQFYGINMLYKLKYNVQLYWYDALLILLNNIIYYSFAYGLISMWQHGEQWLGLFTVGVACINFVIAFIIYQRKQYEGSIFYLIAAIVLAFLTIAIPVQLDGSWVTILWASLALCMLWIAKQQHIRFYQWLSYGLLLLSVMSILHDWATVDTYYRNGELVYRPIVNLHFLNNLLYTLIVSAYAYIFIRKKSIHPTDDLAYKIQASSIITIVLLSSYVTGALEIINYWDGQFYVSAREVMQGEYNHRTYNYNYEHLHNYWLVLYSICFSICLYWINKKRFHHTWLHYVSVAILVIVILAYLVIGLYEISELRAAYIHSDSAEIYAVPRYYLYLRYVSYLFILGWMISYWYLRQTYLPGTLARKWMDLFICFVLIWILSSELLHWMDIYQVKFAYKTGLSILWGIASLTMIVIGILQKNAHIRIAAISLFGITLIKLFFYDIAHLSTIQKVIVMVSLGVLLLIISFLYNKYKHRIDDTPSNM